MSRVTIILSKRLGALWHRGLVENNGGAVIAFPEMIVGLPGHPEEYVPFTLELLKEYQRQGRDANLWTLNQCLVSHVCEYVGDRKLFNVEIHLYADDHKSFTTHRVSDVTGAILDNWPIGWFDI